MLAHGVWLKGQDYFSKGFGQPALRLPSSVLILLFSFFYSISALAYTPEECIRCHTQGSKESEIHISVEEYQASIHGRQGMSCTDCHSAVKDEQHQRMKSASLVTCDECHEQENRHGLTSQMATRPQCSSCHTKHHMLEKGDRASSVHPAALQRTCASCHPVECGQSDYLSWFPSLQIVSHGKQDFSKDYGKGNCIGCHQGAAAHGEKKPINGEDCYNCHLAITGYIHPKADHQKQPGVFAAALIHQALFLVLLWGGFRFYTGTRTTRKKGTGKSSHAHGS